MDSRFALSVSPLDHVLGDVRAAITLFLYGDYESSRCGLLQSLVSIALRALKGQVCVVFRHFPLGGVHPHAQHAAEIAEAAADRNLFWTMHDLLFQHQDALSDADLADYASSVGLDRTWAMTTLRLHTFAPHVLKDFLNGVKNGVTDAPTLFINNKRYEDPFDERSLVLALQDAKYRARR